MWKSACFGVCVGFAETARMQCNPKGDEHNKHLNHIVTAPGGGIRRGKKDITHTLVDPKGVGGS